MIKIKRIELSGFRGILAFQRLNLTQNGGNPTSLVLYGLNSSGKTSFVDGLEWFLSSGSEIEWLKREDARQKAFPHQEAKPEESYVEIEFRDDAQKVNALRKTFNTQRTTKPDLSSEQDFKRIYDSFIIRPYLRYLEVIDFVYNRTGAEKYEKLASWMGFEDELAFQEKIALEILPNIQSKKKQRLNRIKELKDSLDGLTGNTPIEEASIVRHCNALLEPHAQKSFATMKEIGKGLDDLEKLKMSSSVAQKVAQLSRTATAIKSTLFNNGIVAQSECLQEEIKALGEKSQLVKDVDIINLYTQALRLLSGEQESNVKCPVCGKEWSKEELEQHIKDELNLLSTTDAARKSISGKTKDLQLSLRREAKKIEQLIGYYEEARETVTNINHTKTQLYDEKISALETSLGKNVLENEIKSFITKEDITSIEKEKGQIEQLIIKGKEDIQPSKKEIQISEAIEKIKKIDEIWNSLRNGTDKMTFFETELSKFIEASKALSNLIQENITQRFNSISSIIRKYFGILRKDKDIKDIQIVLNLEKQKASGRSAEIQLSYYNISTKPAYKVLSESLLNSLGLAVYFTCVKQFNNECKFIVLDDIMNSLDMGHRDTLLDLIDQEFQDYQIILFTHDLYWFQKIQRRFPKWITKKIKGWDYKTGPKIDFVKTTREDIEELLQDSTKTEQAGQLFTRHVEGLLNELCENLHAEVRYRFTQNDPPAMEELFEALYKRLKDKLNKEHPIIEKVIRAKAYEPLLRNFTGHPRDNYPSSISPDEVKRAVAEWDKVNTDLWCSECCQYVKYIKTKDTIECKCGKTQLFKQSAQ